MTHRGFLVLLLAVLAVVLVFAVVVDVLWSWSSSWSSRYLLCPSSVCRSTLAS